MKAAPSSLLSSVPEAGEENTKNVVRNAEAVRVLQMYFSIDSDYDMALYGLNSQKTKRELKVTDNN